MRAAKVDVNHGDIRDTFRAYGYAVVDLARVGRGFPDLLISKSFITAAIEVKRDAKAKLTPDQMEFHRNWKGLIFVVYDIPGVDQVDNIMRQEAQTRVRALSKSD